MANEKNTNKTQQPIETPVEKEPVRFYPDVEFNRGERKKTIILCAVLLFFLGVFLFAFSSIPL